jgi:hypothetical protein
MPHRAFRTTLLMVGALVLAACSGGDADTEAPAVSAAAPAASVTAPAASSELTAPVYDFATGPTVLVSNDFVPSKERVDSTGAYLPTNGNPTLVFVDAIW